MFGINQPIFIILSSRCVMSISTLKRYILTVIISLLQATASNKWFIERYKKSDLAWFSGQAELTLGEYWFENELRFTTVSCLQWDLQPRPSAALFELGFYQEAFGKPQTAPIFAWHTDSVLKHPFFIVCSRLCLSSV